LSAKGCLSCGTTAGIITEGKCLACERRRGLKGLTRDLPVFCAAAWWRDCEPFASVVALSAKDAELRIEEAVVEEAERAVDDEDIACHCSGSETGAGHIEECPLSEPLDEARDRMLYGIAWSGVHKESLRRVLRDSGFSRGTIVADLKAQGWAFQEVG
jgi:hypothetical protein